MSTNSKKKAPVGSPSVLEPVQKTPSWYLITKAQKPKEGPSFNDIPQFPRAHYEVDVSWDYLEDQLKYYQDEYGLDLNPNFQRAHVWTSAQQIAYVEYIL